MATPTTDLNLGALTTTFSPPPDCSSLTVSTDTAAHTVAPYVYPWLFSSIAQSCFPSNYPVGSAALTGIYSQYDNQDQHVYYSPGLCPSKWLSNSVGSSGAETTAFCCPSGFNPSTTPAVTGGGSSTFCTSIITEATTIVTVAYTGDGASAGLTSTYVFSTNTIIAAALWIRYHASDFPSSATITGSTSSTRSPSSSLPTSKPSNPSSPSKTLSTGTKIGLGFGIPFILICAAAGLAAWFIRRRRRNCYAYQAGNQENPSEEFRGERPPSELPAEGRFVKKFVSARPTSELPADEVAIKAFVARGQEAVELSSTEGGGSYELQG